MRHWRRLRFVVPLVVAVGCGPNTDAYVSLQDTMKSHITQKDGRPVESVSCTPHVHDTVREETAHLRCLVIFTDGSSYTAPWLTLRRHCLLSATSGGASPSSRELIPNTSRKGWALRDSSFGVPAQRSYCGLISRVELDTCAGP